MRSGLLAEFETPDGELLRAVTELRSAGLPAARRVHAVPDPRGWSEALGLRRSPLNWIILPVALAGAGRGYLVQWFCNAFDYPLNVGGRPAHAVAGLHPDHVRDDGALGRPHRVRRAPRPRPAARALAPGVRRPRVRARLHRSVLGRHRRAAIRRSSAPSPSEISPISAPSPWPGPERTERSARMTRGRLLSLSCLAAALCLSCTPVTTADAEPGDADLLDLERMLSQRRFAPYQQTDLFDNGAAMRHLARGRRAERPRDRRSRAHPRVHGRNVRGAHAGPGDHRAAPAREGALRDPLRGLPRGRRRWRVGGRAQHDAAAPAVPRRRARAGVPARAASTGSSSRATGSCARTRSQVPLMERWAIVAYLKALGKSRATALDAPPHPSASAP